MNSIALVKKVRRSFDSLTLAQDDTPSGCAFALQKHRGDVGIAPYELVI